jgi:hypothetical protein
MHDNHIAQPGAGDGVVFCADYDVVSTVYEYAASEDGIA